MVILTLGLPRDMLEEKLGLFSEEVINLDFAVPNVTIFECLKSNPSILDDAVLSAEEEIWLRWSKARVLMQAQFNRTNDEEEERQAASTAEVYIDVYPDVLHRKTVRSDKTDASTISTHELLASSTVESYEREAICKDSFDKVKNDAIDFAQTAGTLDYSKDDEQTEQTEKSAYSLRERCRKIINHAMLESEGVDWDKSSKSHVGDSKLQKTTDVTMQKKIYKGSKKPLSCSLCDRMFYKEERLLEHKNTHHDKRVHDSERNFKCTECGKSFKTKGTLVTHVRIHTGDKPFKCDICSKRFTQASNLQTHKMTHTAEKPFSCDECNAAFRQKGDLLAHKLTHSGEKPYLCAICGKGFIKNYLLKQHMFLHTGDRPHACSLCDKTYARRESLRLHMRLHRGIKPYKCDKCPRCFTNNSALKDHMRYHTGDKPFACSLCTSRFIYPSHLRAHVNRLHKPQPSASKTVSQPGVECHAKVISPRTDIQETSASKLSRDRPHNATIVEGHVKDIVVQNRGAVLANSTDLLNAIYGVVCNSDENPDFGRNLIAAPAIQLPLCTHDNNALYTSGNNVNITVIDGVPVVGRTSATDQPLLNLQRLAVSSSHRTQVPTPVSVYRVGQGHVRNDEHLRSIVLQNSEPENQ